MNRGHKLCGWGECCCLTLSRLSYALFSTARGQLRRVTRELESSEERFSELESSVRRMEDPPEPEGAVQATIAALQAEIADLQRARDRDAAELQSLRVQLQTQQMMEVRGWGMMMGGRGSCEVFGEIAVWTQAEVAGRLLMPPSPSCLAQSTDGTFAQSRHTVISPLTPVDPCLCR
jgi:hypothetical protein